MIRAIIQWNKIGPLTNGSNLLRNFYTYDSILFPFGVSALCIAMIILLIRSTYGRAFKAIREDEVAAEAMGINLFKHKMMSFIISSFFAGISGALLAMFQTTVQAMAFTAAMTYEILLIVVIGGIGSITGSILAAFLFVACSEWWMRFLDEPMYIGGFQVPFLRTGFRMVVFSIVIMAVVLFWRKGIMGTKEFSWDGIAKFFKDPFGLISRQKGKGEVQRNA
ncbi:branched-chain amino acid ABC transporter permease [Fervidicella metallireducens]